MRAVRSDPAYLLVRAGGGQRQLALHALCALFGGMTCQWEMAILGCQNSVTPEPID